MGRSKSHSITNLRIDYGSNGIQLSCYVCGFRQFYATGMRLADIKRDHARYQKKLMPTSEVD